MRRTVLRGLVAALLLAAAPARADHARYGIVLTIDPENARVLLDRGGVAAVDLRPETDFRAGRLPGARSLPMAGLPDRLGDVPLVGVLVLYGEGPVEPVLGAYHLIRTRAAGDVYVLEGGFEAWRRLGYRTER